MESNGRPPSPIGARSYDELSARLSELLAWAGITIREAHRRVLRDREERGVPEVPAFETVRRCVRPGGRRRARIDVDLVVDLARVVVGDEAGGHEWRQACQVIAGRADETTVVQVDRRLPADPKGVIGREAELTELLAGLRTATPGPAVSVICGMPGMGKTTLAVRAAHRRAGRGRVDLAVNLRGYDLDYPPADPAAVLDGFLRALGVAGHEIGRLGLVARRERFAALLAGQSATILLDNAAGAEQVRPLIPAGVDCAVLVTSRDVLDLAGAKRIVLGALSPADSVELLRSRLGPEAVDAAPRTAARIADLGGRLPLALALISGRIGAQSNYTLTDHLDWLLEDRERGRLADGVELAFRSSYEQLPAEMRRLLRLIALHPGREFDGYAAAALTGRLRDPLGPLLTALVSRSMLEAVGTDRYSMHDLVRVFAAEQARTSESPGERRSAIDRLTKYYRSAAVVAMDVYSPQSQAGRPRVPDGGRDLPSFADRADAKAWLDGEYPSMVAVALQPGATGSPHPAVDLSATLFGYLDEAARHRDALQLHGHASVVADGTEKSRVLVNLGATLFRLGRYSEAIERYLEALARYAEHGDPVGAGRAHGNLGVAYAQIGDHVRAAEQLECAVATHRKAGNRSNEAIASGNLCHLYQRLERYDEAQRHGEHHLLLARELGDRLGEGVALGNLGGLYRSRGQFAEALHHHELARAIAREIGYSESEPEEVNDVATDLRLLGRGDEAIGRHREALELALTIGNRYQQARAHEGIGRCLLAAGAGNGEAELKEAIRLYTELGTPEAVELATLLDGTD
ncbi:tetratricopeptide (TPR) repeat protein [Kribbella amoyensis]|uniref:Tetratricopeptide (TPR) repeat protein n=1 Tax=Kribbella amoyensis TaxID=996641 RepID=A0A561BVE0_9ACTN|nr:tetratricopeptide repeat protein [Kribbella amoyensis]TWD82817.1 tetratricopeptide (TPR) repeat protein [Kribbella amoyensis]